MYRVFFAAIFLFVTACGGGAGSSGGLAQTYSLGGTVSGLGSAAGLVVKNGTESISVASSATTFTFANALSQSSAYNVTIQTNPVGKVCSISNGSGVVSGASVGNVAVSCTDVTYSLGGTVSGLTGTGLVLSNASQTLSVPSGATTFAFASEIASGTNFNVRVQTQPSGMTCSVGNGTGSIAYAAVTNISVSCAVNAYSLSGTISGLNGVGLVLASNGQTVTALPGDGIFVFPSPLPTGTTYNVSVQTQPSGLVCSVANWSGTMASANVSNISVSCSAPVIANVSTLAGRGDLAGAWVDGTGSNARFNYAWGAALDSSGNLYVTQLNNSVIRKVTPGGVVTTFAGNGSNGFVNGAAASASFYEPRGIAVDSLGNVYVAEPQNKVIRKITQAGVVSTYAGTGVDGYLDGPIASAKFSYPWELAFDGNDNLYVTEAGGGSSFGGVRKISSTGQVTTLAGSASQGFVDAVGTSAKFNGPGSLTVDASGNVYVADGNNNAIRKISPSGAVTTLAGSGLPLYSDGTGATASFWGPSGITVDTSGNLFVSDYFNEVIRKVSPSGQVTNFAGTRVAGYLDGLATSAKFNLPRGIVVNSSGVLYVVEQNDIRKIVP